MSGPKRADVQAALNTAARSARESAAIIANAERGAVSHMGRRLGEVLAGSDEVRAGLNAARAELDGLEHRGSDTDAARREIDAALAALDGAASGAGSQSTSSRAADDAEAQAKRAYDAAQVEYDRAERGLREAGSHYLHNQMAWAQAARQKFEEAGRLATRAAELRSGSKKTSSKAIENAESAMAGARRALTGATSAVRAGEERARAVAEAQRIAEENRRAAAQAVGQARIAVDALDAADVDKFSPGTRADAAQRVATAEGAYERGDFDAAHRAVDGLEVELARVAAQCTEARRRWEAERAAAVATRSELEAALDSADAALVEQWAQDAAAIANARTTLGDVDRLLADEAFGDAGTAAAAARDAVAAAMADAAAAKGQDVRRREIGDAILDVLEELGFDTSFEHGDRDAPLRINGQTSTPDGRGDFDIEIPLDGEIDFEVTAPEGDITCVNAIGNLRSRLAEQGIEWTVTDWGHAEGHVAGATQTKIQEKTQEKTRSKG